VYSVSAQFQAAIESNTLRIAEIFDVALANGQTVRLSTHGNDLRWNAGSDLYSSFDMKRGPIRRNSDGKFDKYTLNIANISGPFADTIHKQALESATITTRRIRWDADYAADEEIVIFVGRPEVAFNTNVLTVTNRSIFGSLNIVVPRHVFQDRCNHAVFDATCGLTAAGYAYAGTAEGGTALTLVDTVRGSVYKAAFDDAAATLSRGDTVTGSVGASTGVIVQIVYATATTGTIWYVELQGTQFVDNEVLASGGNNVKLSATPAADTTFYEQGELKMTGGDNAGLSRPILADAAGVTTIFWPFANKILAGDAYELYPGCDGVTTTCRDKYDNKINWRGFSLIPDPLEVF